MANQIVCVFTRTYGCKWAEDNMRLCCHLVTFRLLITFYVLLTLLHNSMRTVFLDLLYQ